MHFVGGLNDRKDAGNQQPINNHRHIRGLAEVAGTIMLALVDQSIQATFVWFVMLFPVLNVLLFFLTLNFNPRALYV